MTAWKEVYTETFQADAINASASEDFGAKREQQVNRDKHGSANSLIITSLADEDFEIRLDGLDSRLVGILYTRGSFVIKPEDGIFFSSVKLTNVSATNSTASEVSLRIAKAVRVD